MHTCVFLRRCITSSTSNRTAPWPPGRPAARAPSGFRYDPADPTPAAGGVRLAMGVKAGRVDNTALEARPDVLTYTTTALERDKNSGFAVKADRCPGSDGSVLLLDVLA
ncbi:hypothetical protein ACTMTI_34510 [Nonomuraea sp. H19]|uniref:hypothetical protein n=1 Tax=Nonomuraea sp. H19 TaxID=3452206 RepID=UPI003F8B4240